MAVSLLFVMLYGLKECLTLIHYLSVLDRYHLVEINRLSLIDALWLLVAKSNLP
jgi:hypothetical protein